MDDDPYLRRSPVDLPPTLHGQLYLLAYDRKRRRFDGGSLRLFGFALRAAMLTDLPVPAIWRTVTTCRTRRVLGGPDDPLLRAALDEISENTGRRSWSQFVADHEKDARQLVRDQLVAPAEPRPLAVGLLAVLGQMPTVFSLSEAGRHRPELRELTFCAVAPIVGLHQAIEIYHAKVRADMSAGPS